MEHKLKQEKIMKTSKVIHIEKIKQHTTNTEQATHGLTKQYATNNTQLTIGTRLQMSHQPTHTHKKNKTKKTNT